MGKKGKADAEAVAKKKAEVEAKLLKKVLAPPFGVPTSQLRQWHCSGGHCQGLWIRESGGEGEGDEMGQWRVKVSVGA